MRLCAALALVLVALVVVTVRAAQRPRARVPVAVDAEVDEPPPPADPAPRAFAPPPAHPTVERREAGGIGQLRGRLLFPPDLLATNVEVVAEDFGRRVSALIDDEGRFEVHLPPGRYTLIASQDDLIGAVSDVLVRAGATLEVDISLAIGVAIRGTVDPSEGVSVSASSSGRDDDCGIASIEDGSFSIEGLLPRRSYDITFTGENVRKRTITGVTAPADGLAVALEPPINVRGAFALPDDIDCPFATVEVQSGGKTVVDDDGDEISTAVDIVDCSFSLTAPAPGTLLTLVATGEGWYVEHPIAIPAHGDPAFVRIDL